MASGRSEKPTDGLRDDCHRRSRADPTLGAVDPREVELFQHFSGVEGGRGRDMNAIIIRSGPETVGLEAMKV